jgi:bifunctional enzyme CysN/CysC
VTADGDLEEARAGDAVTLTLSGHIDVARGDVLANPDNLPQVADQFAAHLLWLSEEPLLPGRTYLMRIGMKYLTAHVSQLKHRANVNTGEHIAARTLDMNEIG